MITDAIAYTASGAWKTVEPARTKHVMWQHYDKVRPNPTHANREEAAAMGLAYGADAILAVGGDSSMDTAKTAAVLMKHPGTKPVDFYKKGEPITEALPRILINTSHAQARNATPLPWPRPMERTSRPSIHRTSTRPTLLMTRP